MIALFVIISRCPCARAQHDSVNDEAVIRRAKAIPVSSLDSSLPNVSLEFFLEYEAGGESIHWEVNDCSADSGKRSAQRGNDFRLCVEADFDFKHQSVSVSIVMSKDKDARRSTDASSNEAPSFLIAVITDMSGSSHTLRRLAELPMQLHRPLRPIPRDLPIPAVLSSSCDLSCDGMSSPIASSG